MATHIVYIKRTTSSPVDVADGDIMTWLETAWQQAGGSGAAVQVYLTLDDNHYIAVAEAEDDEAIVTYLRCLRGTGEFEAKASRAYAAPTVRGFAAQPHIPRK